MTLPPPQQMELSPAYQLEQRRCNSSYRRVSGMCGVAARLSGIFSLVIQICVLLLSLLLIVALFVHIGGYALFTHHLNPNGSSTTSATTPEDGIQDALQSDDEGSDLPTHIDEGSGFPAPDVLFTDFPNFTDEMENSTAEYHGQVKRQLNISEVEVMAKEQNEIGKDDNNNESNNSGNLIDDLNELASTARTVTLEALNSTENVSYPRQYHGPFEQIRPINIRIGQLELELLPLLRISSVLYGGLCMLWLLTLVGLMVSLKYEIIDLVYINTFVLVVASLYLLVMIIMTSVLIFYQKEYHWGILLTVCSVVGGLILCFLFNILALGFAVIWHRYIDYMNGGEECMCTSAITKCIKGHAMRGKREQRGGRGPRRAEEAAANYSIPEATRHANIPYIDEPPIQQFSNF